MPVAGHPPPLGETVRIGRPLRPMRPRAARSPNAYVRGSGVDLPVRGLDLRPLGAGAGVAGQRKTRSLATGDAPATGLWPRLTRRLVRRESTSHLPCRCDRDHSPRRVRGLLDAERADRLRPHRRSTERDRMGPNGAEWSRTDLNRPQPDRNGYSGQAWRRGAAARPWSRGRRREHTEREKTPEAHEKRHGRATTTAARADDRGVRGRPGRATALVARDTRARDALVARDGAGSRRRRSEHEKRRRRFTVHGANGRRGGWASGWGRSPGPEAPRRSRTAFMAGRPRRRVCSASRLNGRERSCPD